MVEGEHVTDATRADRSRAAHHGLIGPTTARGGQASTCEGGHGARGGRDLLLWNGVVGES